MIGFSVRTNLFCGFILLASSVLSCGGLSDYDRSSVEQALSDSTVYATETWGVRMDLFQDKQRLIHIISPYATSIETPGGGETTLDGPLTIEVRDTSGITETLVTANKALYKSRIGEFFLTGDVVVKTNNDQTLRTEELTWFQHDRSIETDKFVTIVTPQDSISGNGLTGDDRLETYIIEQVTGRFTLETDRDNRE